MARALAGVRVIEFGGFAAGPVIGKHLGNYGADVIRIESRLRLDGFRFSYPPFKDNIPGPERAGIFNFYNDGKRSITLNLKDPRGQGWRANWSPHPTSSSKTSPPARSSAWAL